MPSPEPRLRSITAALATTAFLRSLTVTLATTAITSCFHTPSAPEPPIQTEIFLPLDDTFASAPSEPAPSAPAPTSPTWVDEHVVALTPQGDIDTEEATVATTHPAPPDPPETLSSPTTDTAPLAGPAPSPPDEPPVDTAPRPRTAELNLDLAEVTATPGASPLPETSDAPAPDTPHTIPPSTTASDQTPHSEPADPVPDVAVTRCAGTQDSDTAQCLLDTVRTRTARAGETLIDTIDRWAAGDGWQLVVETQYDWPLRTSHTTATGLDTAIRQITEAFSRTQPAPTATAYRCNCVLVVRDNAHRPG